MNNILGIAAHYFSVQYCINASVTAEKHRKPVHQSSGWLSVAECDPARTQGTDHSHPAEQVRVLNPCNSELTGIKGERDNEVSPLPPFPNPCNEAHKENRGNPMKGQL